MAPRGWGTATNNRLLRVLEVVVQRTLLAVLGSLLVVSALHVLGRGPIKHSPYDTLLRCVSVWVDVFKPVGHCRHATSLPVTRGGRQLKQKASLAGEEEPTTLRRRIALELYPWPNGPELMEMRKESSTEKTAEDSVDVSVESPASEVVPTPPIPPEPPDPVPRMYGPGLGRRTYPESVNPRPSFFQPSFKPGPSVGPTRSQRRDSNQDSQTSGPSLMSRGGIRLDALLGNYQSKTPPIPPPSAAKLFEWYLSASRLEETGELARKGISTHLIALFGSLSLATSALPGTKSKTFSPRQYAERAEGHHPLTPLIRSASAGDKTYWVYVRRLAKEKRRLMPLDTRDLYWLFMAYLAKAHETRNVLRRKVAMKRARQLFPTLRHLLSRELYGPYVYGLLSLPLDEEILQEAIHVIRQYHADPLPSAWKGIPQVCWEVLRACSQVRALQLAELVVPCLRRSLEASWNRYRREERPNGLEAAPFAPIPTPHDLYAFLFSALQPPLSSAPIYSEPGHYDSVLKEWASSEVENMMSNDTEAAAHLMVALLPAWWRKPKQYEIADGSAAPTPVPSIETWTSSNIVSGLITLYLASTDGRPPGFAGIRERLWVAWLETFPMCGAPPVVHFSILLYFINTTASPEDAPFLASVLVWLFGDQQVLRLPRGSREAEIWQVELSVAILQAAFAALDDAKSRIDDLLVWIGQLFGSGSAQLEVVMNRLAAGLVSTNLRKAVEVLQHARAKDTAIWSATPTRIFYTAFSEDHWDIANEMLQNSTLDDDLRQLYLRSWVENVTRDPDTVIPQSRRAIFGKVLLQALGDDVDFSPWTWRTASHILIHSGDLKFPVSIAERLHQRMKEGRLDGELRAYLPSRLFRNVPLSRSKKLIKRMKRIVPSLEGDMSIPHDGPASPAVVFTTEMRKPVFHQRWQPNRSLVHNLVLTKILRVGRYSPRNLHTIKMARYMLYKVSWGKARVDPVTTNLLLHSVLRSSTMSVRNLQHLFDRLFVLGYPGSEAHPNGFFGTLREPRVPSAEARQSIHPTKHARPFYRQFIRAFSARGDWLSAKKVIGLLHLAKQAEAALHKAAVRKRRMQPEYLERKRQRLLKHRPASEDPRTWEGLTTREMKARLDFYYHNSPYDRREIFYSTDSVP